MNLDHGKVSIKIDGNIIIVHLVGEFNEFGAKNYSSRIKEEVSKFEGKPFSILVNLLDMLGGTPEAFKEVDELNYWLSKQNLLKKARVIKSVATLSMVQTLANSKAKQIIGDFEEYEQAITWLKSE